MVVSWLASSTLRRSWPGLLGVALVASLVGLVYFVLLNHAHGERDRLRARVEAKYAAALDPNVDLSPKTRHGEVDVVGRVDGVETLCTIEVIDDEPYVFCGHGHGVEADRR
jgi:hypothetical protein